MQGMTGNPTQNLDTLRAGLRFPRRPHKLPPPHPNCHKQLSLTFCTNGVPSNGRDFDWLDDHPTSPADPQNAKNIRPGIIREGTNVFKPMGKWPCIKISVWLGGGQRPISGKLGCPCFAVDGLRKRRLKSPRIVIIQRMHGKTPPPPPTKLIFPNADTHQT